MAIAVMAENIKGTTENVMLQAPEVGSVSWCIFFCLLGNSCLYTGIATGEAVVIYVWVVQGVDRCHSSSWNTLVVVSYQREPLAK